MDIVRPGRLIVRPLLASALASLLASLLATLLVQGAALAGELVPIAAVPIPLGFWPIGDAGPTAATSPFDGSQLFDNLATQRIAYFAGAGAIVMDWGMFHHEWEFEAGLLDFAYATRSQGPVDLVVRLHQHAQGFGRPGEIIIEYPLHGLPGSHDGRPVSYTGTIIIPAQQLPPGPFGWSYQAFDDDTGPLLAAPLANQGIVDELDLYDAALAYQGGVNFGGQPVASLAFGLFGGMADVNAWQSLGGDLDGSDVTWLIAEGTLLPGTACAFQASGFLPGAPAIAVFGTSVALQPFHGGTLVPAPQVIVPFVTDRHGHVHAGFLTVEALPSGVSLIVQFWSPDPQAPGGFAATNAKKRTTP